jgi:hypothetical protein
MNTPEIVVFMLVWTFAAFVLGALWHLVVGRNNDNYPD